MTAIFTYDIVKLIFIYGKYYIVMKISLGFFSMVKSNIFQNAIVPNNGLSPNKRQAIVWGNGDLTHGPIYAKMSKHVISIWNFSGKTLLKKNPPVAVKRRVLSYHDVIINKTLIDDKYALSVWYFCAWFFSFSDPWIHRCGPWIHRRGFVWSSTDESGQNTLVTLSGCAASQRKYGVFMELEIIYFRCVMSNRKCQAYAYVKWE